MASDSQTLESVLALVCRSTHTPLDRTRFAEAWQPSTFLRDLILGMAAGHSCVCSLLTLASCCVGLVVLTRRVLTPVWLR